MKFLIIWCLYSIMAIALPIHYVSTTNVSVGDSITYTVEFPANLITSIEPTFNGFEIIESQIDRRSSSMAHVFKLQVFSIDNLQIPTMSLTAINGLAPIVLSPISLNLISVLNPTENQLNDIESILSMTYINWMALISLMLCVLLIGGGSIAWKNKQEKQLDEVVLSEEPPLQKALKEIELIESSLTDEPIELKLAYYKLTEIFCEFITHETGLNVLDATTNEMKVVLRDSKKLDPDHVKSIILISSEMDYFKFSKKPEYNQKNVRDIINAIIKLMGKLTA